MAVNPEDFGAVPVAANPRPEDFGAEPLQRRQADKPVAAPKSRFDQYAEAFKNISPYMSPVGAIMKGVQYGLDTSNDALTRGAYNAGGAVTDAATRMGATPETAAGAGYATNVGLQAIPAFVGGKAVEKLASPLLKSEASNLMQSSLKPVLVDLKKGNAADAIQTMLDEGISVTPGGVQKLREKISDLNKQIASSIASSTATVDKGAVWKSVKEKLDYFTKQVNPQGDIASIKTAWQNFIDHPLYPGSKIPVQDAQALKQGTYKVLAGKYGELGSASTEAEKAIARGLKNEIAKAVPGISELNAQDSKLINALNVTERRVLMEANKNPAGLSLLAHNPAAWAAFMADRSGAFKSLIARMINYGSERIPQAAGSAGALAGEQVYQRQGQQ